LLPGCLVGPRCRPLYNRGVFSGLAGNWVDEAAGQGIGENPVDGFRDLAKVGVAGSNPVFRSKRPGQRLARGSNLAPVALRSGRRSTSAPQFPVVRSTFGGDEKRGRTSVFANGRE
jgi:hypothetical protein